MFKTALWTLLKPVLTTLVNELAKKVLAWADEQARNGTLSVTSDIPESLTEELVNDLLA